tara:strand:- start:599 stop:2212 length:1614 start_codon:yes stop_codon:yes gene_type:complete
MPYIGNQPGTGVRNRFIYTATASQTTFTGADNNSKTLSYADSAYVDVFLNGICLVPGTDYTASTKTSIVLTQAASLSDTLEVIAYDVASMDDSLSTSDGGTILGNLGVSTSSPDLTFTNTTSEDTDGGRESTITFKGKQSGGEESTLAEIRASHDATADDQKGDLIFKTNDGSDGTSPTEAMRIESDQQVLITTSADAKGLTIKNSGDNRPYLNMDANRSGAGNNLSQINFKWDGTDVARIIAVAGADTTNKDDAHITFGTASAGSVDERMRLTSSGGLAIGSTDNNGFNLKVEGLTMLESGNNETFGQLFIHGTGSSTGDAQISMHTDSNGRAIYVDESDANTLRFSGGAGKGHSSDFKIDNSGNVTVGGSLSKGSGSFKIRHPLESKKDTHWLVHSFVEGPQADNLYRGRVTLEDGVASVNVDIASGMTDGTFVLLNRDIQCFTTNETGWTPIKGSVSGNILTITAQDNTCTDTISWMVIGERQDDHMKQNTTGWTDSDGKIIIEPELTKTEKEDNTEIIENPVLKFDYSELEAE